MADKKVSAIPTMTAAPATTDKLVILDDPGGTPALQTVTVANLLLSYKPTVVCEVELTGSIALTTSAKKYIRIPSKLNGWNLVGVAAMCKAASSSGVPTFTIKNGATSMLTTNLTIDAGEYDSSTATAAVIDTANDGVLTGAQIEIACSVAGTGVTYAVVELTFQLP